MTDSAPTLSDYEAKMDGDGFDLEGPRAELESLSALAEFGIDLEAAIVFDPEQALYVVREGGLVYVFEPPALPSEADESDDREAVFETSESVSATEADAVASDDSATEPGPDAVAVAVTEDEVAEADE